jgi:hypothetical protein
MSKSKVYAPTNKLESLLPVHNLMLQYRFLDLCPYWFLRNFFREQTQASTSAIAQVCYTALKTGEVNDIVSSLEVLVQIYLYRPKDGVSAVQALPIFDLLLNMMQHPDPIVRL